MAQSTVLAGGAADKLGNRYETLFVVKQLLRLVSGDLVSVQVERPGPEADGIDIETVSASRARTLFQCKRHLGGRAAWSIAELTGPSGPLRKALSQLNADLGCRFTFVSATPAPWLRQLTDSARLALDDAEAFDEYLSESVRESLEKAATALVLPISPPDALKNTVEVFARIEAVCQPDGEAFLADLREMASRWVTGDAEATIEALRALAADCIGRRITVDDVVRRLAERGLVVRRIEWDERTRTSLQRSRERFLDATRPWLANGDVLHRRQVDELLNELLSASPPVLLFVDGAAGQGKSGVLNRLAIALDERSVPWIGTKLDAIGNVPATTNEWGGQVGLPGSPLDAIGRSSCADLNNLGVVLIDQVDALSWGSRSERAGFALLRDLAREAKTAREDGRRVVIVVACRTFDLNHDSELRRLDAENEWSRPGRVTVGELTLDEVDNVLRNAGVEVPESQGRLREMLRTVQNLKMFLQIAYELDDFSAISTATQLTCEYLRTRIKEASRGTVSADECVRAIDEIIDRAERTGHLSVAESTLDLGTSVARDRLASVGVLQSKDRRVSFAHQTLLDYSIGRRAIRRIDDVDGGLSGWLGDRSLQTLDRREPLRQALLILASEDPDRFLTETRRLLFGPGIRFHLRVLALELLGRVEPTDEITDLLVELCNDETWLNRVMANAIRGEWKTIEALRRRGVLNQWLESDDQHRKDWSLRLAESIADRHADRTAAILEPSFVRLSVEDLSYVFTYSRPDAETARLFQLRLAWLRRGGRVRYIEYSRLASAFPKRALRLYAAALRQNPLTRGSRYRNGNGEGGGFRGTAKDVRGMSEASRRCPRYAWRCLRAELDRIRRARHRAASKGRRAGDRKRCRWQDDWPIVPKSLFRFLVVAGRTLARRDAEKFWNEFGEWSDAADPVLRALFRRLAVAMPVRFADRILDTFAMNPTRLGERRRHRVTFGTDYRPAARLIRRFGPHLSDALFGRLESALLAFHDIDERGDANLPRDYRLDLLREGWGRAQHQLLPALDECRRSDTVNRRIQDWRRKFGDDDSCHRPRLAAQVHPVVSPITDEVACRMSNAAWRRLITNSTLPRDGGEWRQTGRGFEESSASSFSRQYGTAVERDPNRFVELTLDLLDQAPVDPLYVHAALHAALHAASRETPDPSWPESVRAEWRASRAELVERLVLHDRFPSDDFAVIAGCRAIASKRTTDSESVARFLIRAASHEDPAPDELAIRTMGVDRRADWSIEDISNNGFALVRSSAAQAIAWLLKRRPDLVPMLAATAYALADDPHLTVRMSAILIAESIERIAEPQSKEIFFLATEGDLRVASTRYGVDYFRRRLHEDDSRFDALIDRMLDSASPAVVEIGASQAVARQIQRRDFGAVRSFLSGSSEKRQGIASAMPQLLPAALECDEAREIVRALLDDADEKVRRAAASWVLRSDFARSEEASPILREFVRSEAYLDHASDDLCFLKRISTHDEEGAAMLFEATTRLLERAASTSPEELHQISHAVGELGGLLLRVHSKYDGPDARSIRDRCLDQWDALLESGVTSALVLTKELEG